MAPPCFSTTKRVTHNNSTWSLACSVDDISGLFEWLVYLIMEDASAQLVLTYRYIGRFRKT